MSVAFLQVEDVYVHHGDLTAVRGASLVANQGEVVGLVGPNGAGKTSLLEAIAGLNRVSSGAISVAGDRLSSLRPDQVVRRGVSLCPEGRHLFSRMSCLENLRLAWEGSGRRTAGRKGFSQAVEGLVDFVPELEGYLHRRGGELSGGQQQLVAVARAWIARPRVLLLDEPTLGLAPTNAERINLLIGQLARSQSVTALVVEENVDLSVRLCDRMYLMRSSEIVAELATADAEARDDVVKRMVFGLSV